MQTMITFAGGSISTDVLYHENMHQWWGDNVTEGSYNLTFFKEGLATLAEFLYQARLAERKAGRSLHAQGSGRVPGQPRAPLQSRLRPGQELLDRRSVQPAGVRPVQRVINV
ncbi:MAG: M1 family aminopeptidase [Streptosporangiaceae bacterium]